MATTNEAAIRITGNASDLARALSSVERGFAGLERTAKKAGGFISRALSTAGGVVIGGGINAALGAASSAASDFFGRMVEGGRESTQSALFLRNALNETGGNLAAATEEATNFARALGLTVAESSRLRATASLGLQGTGIDPGLFLDRAADLLASRGRPLSELQETIQQVFAGSDEGIGRLLGGGENPSTIWEAYAASVGKAAGTLTDLEKKQAVVNVVMQRAALNSGAAGQQLTGLAGIVQQINSLVTELAAKIGEALSRNVGVLNIVNSVKDALLNLVTNQGAFDAFIQGLADGFVFVANKAIDFAAGVARAINGFIGFIKRGQVFGEQILLSIVATVRDVVIGIQLLILDGLRFTSTVTLQILGGIETAITAFAEGTIGRVKAFLEAIGPAGQIALGIPPGVLQNLENLSAGLDLTKTGITLATDAFKNSTVVLDGWEKSLHASAQQTTVLWDKAGDLTKQYALITQGTKDANVQTDAFFNGLRTGIPEFAKFNEKAALTPGVAPLPVSTKLVISGDTLESELAFGTAQVNATNELAAAAGTTKTATAGLQTEMGALRTEVVALRKAVVDPKIATLEVTAGPGTSVSSVTVGSGSHP